MKPHIEQTIADLRAEMHRCQEMIDFIVRLDPAPGAGTASSPLPASQDIAPLVVGFVTRDGVECRPRQTPGAKRQSPSAARKPGGGSPIGNSLQSLEEVSPSATRKPGKRQATRTIVFSRRELSPSAARKPGTGSPGGTHLYGKSAALLAACLSLPADFTVDAFIRASGHAEKAARLVIYRWSVKGWVSKIPGGYRRLPAFPAPSQPSSDEPLSETPLSSPAGNDKGQSAKGSEDKGQEPELKLPVPHEAELESLLKIRDHHRAAGREKMALVYQRKVDALSA